MIVVHRFSILTAFSTFLLLCAGALVTGTGSGLAVPDWPLSFGQFFPKMVGGVLFEHGHRMVAGSVGILTLILTILVFLKDKRNWVKLISASALLAVLIQAILGGLTVIFRLPVVISVMHACLAQLFFCAIVVLVWVTSPNFDAPKENNSFDDSSVFPLTIHASLTFFILFFQLVLGATMRHLGSGLSIPDFPLVFGGFIPSKMGLGVWVHYFHRIGAFVLIFFIGSLAVRIFQICERNFSLIFWAGVLVSLLSIQIGLGAMSIWLKLPVPLTTLHLANGALLLSSSLVVFLKIFMMRKKYL